MMAPHDLFHQAIDLTDEKAGLQRLCDCVFYIGQTQHPKRYMDHMYETRANFDRPIEQEYP